VSTSSTAIDPAHGRRGGALVGELDLHLARVADDVRVGDERPARVDHEPGARAAVGADGDDARARGGIDRGDVALLPRADRCGGGRGIGGGRIAGVEQAERRGAAGDERGGDEAAGDGGGESAAAARGRRGGLGGGRGRR
jgi:hypothetical protein